MRVTTSIHIDKNTEVNVEAHRGRPEWDQGPFFCITLRGQDRDAVTIYVDLDEAPKYFSPELLKED